ncbi:MAG: YbjN domain-containing protein [Deltaproteobacteria bacterium]|nr:YbjN domain-containing protein [Deltaproteobacteria bacterium]
MAAATPTLASLLAESGLADKAESIDDTMYRLQWGSAFVIVGTSGQALVAIAPMFRNLPAGKELAFYRKLLEHNAYMGGMASFAIQPDGWVVLHAGRPIKGIDAAEFAVLVSGVGRFADQFDDALIAEFWAGDASAAGATIAE